MRGIRLGKQISVKLQKRKTQPSEVLQAALRHFFDRILAMKPGKSLDQLTEVFKSNEKFVVTAAAGNAQVKSVYPIFEYDKVLTHFLDALKMRALNRFLKTSIYDQDRALTQKQISRLNAEIENKHGVNTALEITGCQTTFNDPKANAREFIRSLR